MTTVDGSIAFVTGGQRGLGRLISQRLLEAGAAKVYVTARHPAAASDPRIVPLAFELANPDAAEHLARLAADVNVVVNNAGIMTFEPLLADSQDEVDRVFQTVAFGPLRIAKAFAPVLAANGGGALVNLHSLTAWIAGFPGSGTYGAAKAALISMTNSLRIELAAQGTQVLGVQLGLTDTDLVRHLPGPKNDPASVAADIVAALAAGQTELLVDDYSRYFKAALAGQWKDSSSPHDSRPPDERPNATVLVRTSEHERADTIEELRDATPINRKSRRLRAGTSRCRTVTRPAAYPATRDRRTARGRRLPPARDRAHLRRCMATPRTRSA